MRGVLVEVLFEADDQLAHPLLDGDDGVQDLLREVEPVPLPFSDCLLHVALQLRIQAGRFTAFAVQEKTITRVRKIFLDKYTQTEKETLQR